MPYGEEEEEVGVFVSCDVYCLTQNKNVLAAKLNSVKFFFFFVSLLPPE